MPSIFLQIEALKNVTTTYQLVKFKNAHIKQMIFHCDIFNGNIAIKGIINGYPRISNIENNGFIITPNNTKLVFIIEEKLVDNNNILVNNTSLTVDYLIKLEVIF